MMSIAYIGLGSNLGDSQQILSEAVQKLQRIGDIKVSRLYKSAPMGPQDQPDYLNAVVQLKTTLAPLLLLDQLQSLEQEAGRVRLRHWGERTLDLDLLLFDDQQIQHERLTVPHQGILERDFVLCPLLDIDPDIVIHQQKVKTLQIVEHASVQVFADQDWANV